MHGTHRPFREAIGKIFDEDYYGEDFREKLLRIVINTIIYMTSASAVVEHESQDEIDRLIALKKRGKLKLKDLKQLEQLEETPHYILGTDITITRQDIEEIEKVQKADRQGGLSGRKLKHPSITRGHWRWQPYGPGRRKRKRIWIRPLYPRQGARRSDLRTHLHPREPIRLAQRIFRIHEARMAERALKTTWSNDSFSSCSSLQYSHR